MNSLNELMWHQQFYNTLIPGVTISVNTTRETDFFSRQKRINKIDLYIHSVFDGLQTWLMDMRIYEKKIMRRPNGNSLPRLLKLLWLEDKRRKEADWLELLIKEKFSKEKKSSSWPCILLNTAVTHCSN